MERKSQIQMEGVEVSLSKPLSIIVLILIAYQLIIAWIWHLLGVEGYPFWWLTGLLNLVCFPLLFLNIVYKQKPKETTGWWTFGAYLVCWLPLTISTIIGHIVRTHVSGYYDVMENSAMAGAMENIAVGQLVVLVQCVCLTVLLFLFIGEKAGLSDRKSD